MPQPKTVPTFPARASRAWQALLASARLRFFATLAAAICLSAMPVLSWPFSLFAGVLHEAGHGLMALATGGEVLGLRLSLVAHPDRLLWARIDVLGFYQGGHAVAATFAGFAGAALGGAMLYHATLASRTGRLSGALLLGGICLLGALGARDPAALAAIAGCACLPLLTLLPCRGRGGLALRVALRIFALHALQTAFRSPSSLWAMRRSGDGALLSFLTHRPEAIWVVLWAAIALLLLRQLLILAEGETPASYGK